QSPYGFINGGGSYNIIPYKKGTNKVFIKTGSKYLSGKGEGGKLQYSDSIGDDELFELVQIQPSPFDNRFQFHIVNKNGVPLGRTIHWESFTNPGSGSDDINFHPKSNNEINNWLKEWYPGKENEKQKYDKVEVNTRERIAKDSSGNVIKNSWVNHGSDYYYAGSDGGFLTGWKEIEGKTYYFNPDTATMF
ncbi:cell wall-binding protein, partial [Bacillus thuringiensis]|nr:cell wall-binding protein [Bacillus thuringiensis]MRB61704.1 cell wall-binding protein [Bacillus thuringiensis]